MVGDSTSRQAMEPREGADSGRVWSPMEQREDRYGALECVRSSSTEKLLLSPSHTHKVWLALSVSQLSQSAVGWECLHKPSLLNYFNPPLPSNRNTALVPKNFSRTEPETRMDKLHFHFSPCSCIFCKSSSTSWETSCKSSPPPPHTPLWKVVLFFAQNSIPFWQTYCILLQSVRQIVIPKRTKNRS